MVKFHGHGKTPCDVQPAARSPFRRRYVSGGAPERCSSRIAAITSCCALPRTTPSPPPTVPSPARFPGSVGGGSAARPRGGAESRGRREQARRRLLTVILLDTSALIAVLGDEPAAMEVRNILTGEAAAMTTLNLAEAVDRLERRYRLPIARTRPLVEGLLDQALRLVPLGATEAWRPAEIRARHYHRARCPISLADAVLIASARPDDQIASADSHVLQISRREGVATVVLPDSRGRRAGADRADYGPPFSCGPPRSAIARANALKSSSPSGSDAWTTRSSTCS